MVRTIIVGIGNPVLGDDAVGLHVVRALKERGVGPDIVIEEAFTGGMNLLDIILGYDRAILVDAVFMPDIEVGKVLVMDPMIIPSAHSRNPHDLSFPEAVEVAKRMGEKRIPTEIILIAVNIVPVLDFSSELSQKVSVAIPEATLKVRQLMQ